jgi:short-subunit dehydrogenase
MVDVLCWLKWGLLSTALVTILSYLALVIRADFFFKPQDLKKKYGAQWALVTGASSGIGKALTEKLAAQGLNVVLVALPEAVFDTVHEDLQKKYPKQEFRKVAVNLGQVSDTYSYIDQIAAATKDIDVQIVFNNAGYIVLKLFAVAPLPTLLQNIECNVISHVKIAHLFMTRMTEKKLPGCVAFTSSASAFFPAPGGAMYAAGKHFLATMAASLAIEARPFGIDITCLLGGPMRTRFYEGVTKLDAFKFYDLIMSTPESVADTLLASVGRIVWRDAHVYTYVTRLVTKIVDMNLLVEGIALVQPHMADFKKLQQK